MSIRDNSREKWHSILIRFNIDNTSIYLNFKLHTFNDNAHVQLQRFIPGVALHDKTFQSFSPTGTIVEIRYTFIMMIMAISTTSVSLLCTRSVCSA